jgi:hypothetical protein
MIEVYPDGQRARFFNPTASLDSEEDHAASLVQSMPIRASRADTIRAMPVEHFIREAEAVVESDPVVSSYASCEWDCLHEDGQLWIAAIVREALARAAERSA